MVPIQSNSPKDVPTIENLVSQDEVLPEALTDRLPISKSAEIVDVDEEELQAGRDELLSLIEEYNQNLHDREKRAEIEQRVASISEGYKKQVLAKVKSLKADP